MAIALVDYDNVTRAAIPERRPADVAANLEELCQALTHQAAVVLPALEELQLRLYGGWVERSGRLTDRARWLQAALPDFRTRINRVRVRPLLATALTVSPEDDFVGTYRADEELGQKMVDGMMSVDALGLATTSGSAVLIVSDDDDFVPATVASFLTSTTTARRAKILLLRRHKALGDAPNDHLLQHLGISVLQC